MSGGIGGVSGGSSAPGTFDPATAAAFFNDTATTEIYTPDSIFLDDPEFLAVGRGEGEIGRGESGHHVRSLQFVLRILDKIPLGARETTFGNETANALAAFQREEGLVASGSVDRDTLIALDTALAERNNPLTSDAPYNPSSSVLDVAELEGVGRGDVELAAGSSGAGVRALQDALVVLGHLPNGQADGAFGPITGRALKAFQEANGLAGTSVLDKETFIALDRRLNHLTADGASAPRATALPAPDPLTRAPSAYLHNSTERAAYDFIENKLWTGQRFLRIDLAVTNDDTLRILDKLNELPPSSYNNVLHALAATKGDGDFEPTLLDKFIVRGTSDFGNSALSRRFCEQLEAKLTQLGDTPENKIFRHISPDSVDQLQSWSGFQSLVNLIG
jgi:peptidoglycan hydrolase-like protein with peptidoglycan-binding domain